MPRVIITIPDHNPQPYRFQLDREVATLGRSDENDIVIDSGSVSGRHAEMHRIHGGYELVDVGSTNGIKLNGVRKQKIALYSGMSVNLGDVAFDFSLNDEELEVLAKESPSDHSQKDEVGNGLPPLPSTPEPAKPAGPEPEAEEVADVDQAPVTPLPKAGIGVSMGMIVVFLALALVTFFIGANIRHTKETGESLLKGFVNKDDYIEATKSISEEPAE